MTTDPHAGAELTDGALQDEIDRALGIERGRCAGPEDVTEHAHRSWRRQNA